MAPTIQFNELKDLPSFPATPAKAHGIRDGIYTIASSEEKELISLDNQFNYMHWFQTPVCFGHLRANSSLNSHDEQRETRRLIRSHHALSVTRVNM